MAETGTHLTAGARLLASGEWLAAKEQFDAAVSEGGSAEGLSGLGEALLWLGDIARAIEVRERAYVAFRDRGDTASAVRMALWLASEHGAVGNAAVGNGWLGRAERMLAELGACSERGWFLLRRSRGALEPARAESLAGEALRLAHELGDRDLEIAAISQRGRALLAGGKMDEGFACLDEAMAAATSGEAQSIATVADTCCDMIGACERAMEIERATQWCQVTDELARRIKFLPFFAYCRVTYAGVLISLGRWTEAERELMEALRTYEASLPSKSVLAVAKLAELRLLQGRDAEAEELLAEHALSPACAKVFAMLQLARGDAAAAARVLRKRLAAVEGDLLLAAPLLPLLVDAHLACGETDAAAAAAERLEAIAATMKRAPFEASAAMASALVACARRGPSTVDRFEKAIELFASVGLPLPAARARLALARCLAPQHPRAAKDECRAAVAALEQLGAKRDLDAAADLRRTLGVGAKVGPRTTSKLTRREDEVLALVGLGLSNGAIGARLFISSKTVEHHVGHILAKLGLETRAAAAAYAAKKPGRKPSPK